MVHTARSAFHRLLLIRLTSATSVAFIAIAAVGAIAALGVSVRTWFIKQPVARRPIPALAQSQPTREPLKIIQITLRPEGFEPAEITVPKGRHMFILLNRTGPTDLSLQLSRVTGAKEKLKDIKFEERKRFRWYELIDLPPGDFAFSVQSHPEWVCRITSTSN